MADSDLELALRIRAAFEGQQALVGLASSFIDVNKQIETLKRGLTSLSGTTEGALREFEYIKEVADKNGISILDLSENYLKLASSAKGTALEGESTRKLFESMSAALNVLGADTVTTTRAFNSLSQMISKGQIYSEELKGQLAEALPGALQIMASALNITTREMLDLMKAGQLSSDVLLPFAYELDKRYGTLSGSTTTFVQAMARLKNTWLEFIEGVGSLKIPFFDATIWDGVVGAVSKVGESTVLLAGAVGAALFPALVKATDATKNLILASKERIASLFAEGTAAQVAAKAALQKAQADEAAALAAVQQAKLTEAQTAASVRSAELQVVLAQRRLNDLIAQGAAADKVAIAQERLAITQDRLNNALVRNGIAGDKVTATNERLAASSATVATAQGAVAKTQGTLSTLWGYLTGPAGTIALMIAGFAAMALAFREQDESTKILQKSTEDYEESLRRLKDLQLNDVVRASKEQIDAKKEEIAILEQQLKKFDDYISKAESLGVANEAIAFNEERRNEIAIKLEKSQSDLAVMEGKRVIALEESARRLVDLNKVNEDSKDKINKLKLETGNLRDAITILGDAYPRTNEETKQLALYNEQLTKKQDELTKAESAAKTSKDTLTESIKNFSEYTKISEEDIWAAITASDAEISAMDEKRKAIIQSIRDYIDLHKEQSRIEATLKRLSAEYKLHEASLNANADSVSKLAQVYGTLAERRDAELNKANAAALIAQDQLTLSEKELEQLNNLLDGKERELKLSDKNEEKVGKEIGSIKKLIVEKEAEIVKRKSNVTVTEAEAEAIRLSIQLTTDSYEQWRIKFEELQTESTNLHNKLSELLSADRLDPEAIKDIFEQIRKKEEEIAEASKEFSAIINDAFKSIGVDAEQASTDMDFSTKKMISSLTVLADQGKLTGLELTRSINKAINAADTTTEIESIIRMLSQLALNGKISGAELSLALGEAYKKLADLQSITDPVQQSLEKLGVGVPEKLKAIADENERLFNIVRNSGEPIDKVQQAFLRYAESALVAAQNGAEIDEAQLKSEASSLKLSDALTLLIGKYPKLNSEQDAQIAIAERNVQASQSIVDSLEAVAQAQIDGIQQEIDLAKAKGQTWTAQQKTIELNKVEAEWQTAIAGAKQALIAAEIAETQAKLEAKKAIEDKTQADIAEIHALELKLIAQGKQAEAQALAQQLAQKRLDNLNKGIATDKEATESTNQVTHGFVEQTLAAKENARAMEDDQKATSAFALLQKQLTEYLNGARERMDALSSSARLYFEAMLEGTLAANNIAGAQQGSLRATQAWTTATREGSDVLAEFSQKIASSSAQMGAARQDLLFAADDMRVWISAISLAEAAATKGFYEQAQSAERLRLRIHELSESGRLDIGTLTQAEQEATSGFKLLDDQDLANLRSEIEAANQKLRDMQEETEDARSRLADLNAELLEAKGEDQKAKLLRQQIDYQERLAEIERQRREAELMGNTELVAILNQQAAVLRQINDAKVASIQTDQNAEQAGDKVARSWQGAEAAIRSTGAALGEVHNLGVKVAEIDLSGLSTGLAQATAAANNLSRLL